MQRAETNAAKQNTPFWFGEWSISTNFNATDEFLKQWADAQKLMYSKSSGWIVSRPHTTELADDFSPRPLQFWSFKIEDSASVKGLQRQWFGNISSVRLVGTHSPFD